MTRPDGASLLTPNDLAHELTIALGTLANWRYRGEGPPHLKVGGAVRYRRSDVDAWLASRAA